MKNITSYKVIFWDFDGVLINSMLIREEGFKKVLLEFPQFQVQKLIEYHRSNGGLSRYVKFRYFFENIRNENLSEERLANLARKYSEIMRGSLTNKSNLISESNEYLKKHYKKQQMHLVSGSDGNELRFLCNELNLSRYFKSITGSPTPKNHLVENILKIENYLLEEVCLIGDSINDLEAAQTNAINFFGYNNFELKAKGTGYINSFEDL